MKQGVIPGVNLARTVPPVVPANFLSRKHLFSLFETNMPVGSLLGGVLAHYSLRLPMYVGGVIATTLAFLSIGFLLNIAETAKPSK
jgi:hypothetical protein